MKRRLRPHASSRRSWPAADSRLVLHPPIVLQSSTEPGTATVREQLAHAVVMIALGVLLVLPH